MSLRADSRYTGEVTQGKWMESQKGTLGFQLMLECEEGGISHTIWVTEKNKEKAAEAFAAIGVTKEQLTNASFLRNEMPTAVVGVAITFGTKEEEYNNKKRVVVSWIGTPKAPKAETIEDSVAALFQAEDIPF